MRARNAALVSWCVRGGMCYMWLGWEGGCFGWLKMDGNAVASRDMADAVSCSQGCSMHLPSKRGGCRACLCGWF